MRNTELMTHHQPEEPPPTGRVQERLKGDTVHFPESLSLASILAEQCMHHQERLWMRMAKDHPETNPITIKPQTSSHSAEQFSWLPLPSCSPPGCPFPIKSLALSAHVSPWTILYRVLDKSPLLGPCRGLPPSYNRLNPHPLHCKSLPLDHQGSPRKYSETRPVLCGG